VKRIIPALTLFNDSTWVTRRFQRRLNSGDLVNAVRFFSEMDADELSISVPGFNSQKEIIKLLESAIKTSTVPISVAANFVDLDDVNLLFGLGVDKVCLRVSPPLISKFQTVAQKYGSQSVCGVIYTHEYSNNHKDISLIQEALECGVGEFLAIDVQRDGNLCGMDTSEFQFLKELNLGVPLLIRGGIASYSEVNELLQMEWISGVVASSLFLCTADGGSVLPNYELEELHGSSL
jgi:imidazole glycerol phosphate synthase subunit HisF